MKIPYGVADFYSLRTEGNLDHLAQLAEGRPASGLPDVSEPRRHLGQ